MAIDQAEAAARGQVRRAKRPLQTFTPDTRAGGSTGALGDALRQYAAWVQEEALRSAVYAGAKLLYDELLQRVPVGLTGNLKAACYHWHDEKQSFNGRQVYAVGVNKNKAPHWYNVEYGHVRVNRVVYTDNAIKAAKYPSSKPAKGGGFAIPTKEKLPAPRWVPANPYLRPTADRLPDAIEAMKRRLAEKLKEYPS
jgi:hypothetical protein